MSSQYNAVAAKVRAMYGLRVTHDDYARMSAMASVSEVGAFLKTHSAYKETLGNMDAASIADAATLEERLEKDLLSDYFRILSFVARADMPIMRFLAMSMELREIMKFMHLAEAGRPSEYVFSMPKFFDRYSKIRYSQLADTTDYSGLLDALRETPYYAVLSQLELRASGWPDYTTVEMAVRSSYYRWVMSTVRKPYNGAQQQQLREAVGIEADMRNITAIFRIKRSFPKAADVVLGYLLPVFYKLDSNLVKQLMAANDEEAMLNLLRHSGFASLFPDQAYDDVDRYYYNGMIAFYRRLLRAGTPHVGTPMAYLHLKELEIRNLTTLIECVRYQLPPDKAMSYLYLV
jgi:V/A-type H+-transporting ATPase subunit C